MKPIARVLLIVSALGSAAGVATAGPSGLGTLLYSPEQRIDIENGRKPESGIAPEVALKRLSGVLRRSGAKGTVWLNDQAIREDGPDAPRLQGLDAVVKGRRLKVGESVDTFTGEVSDLVPMGSVKAQNAKPKP